MHLAYLAPWRFNLLGVLIAAVSTLGFNMLASESFARTIEWSGYTWHVRDSGGNPQGPGPNIFSNSTQNVFVDANRDLHLKIRRGENGKWLASEIDLTQSLTFGTYEWEVASRYDQLAANVVAGLFTYLNPQSVASQTGGVVGNGVPDTPHEIDIELTRAWGSANLHFTTHDGDVPAPTKNFYQALNSDFTTHRFTWEPDRITWESFHGHVAGVARPPNPIVEQRPGANRGKPARTVYTGPVIPADLNEIPIINFWISGTDPSNNGPLGGAEQELIVRRFAFTPLPSLATRSGDFDADGDVDGDDYLVWRRDFGLTTSPAADGNGNGAVDAADYIIWRRNLGAAASATHSGNDHLVPEPTAIYMASTGWLLFHWLLRSIAWRPRRPTSNRHCALLVSKDTRSLRNERPKLSDGGHGARRLQPARDAAVRCSAWLGCEDGESAWAR